MKRIVFCLLMFIGFSNVLYAEEDIRAFYEEVSISGKAFNISYSSAEEIEKLIIETNDIDDGVYEVTITRVGDHIYKIDGTKFYIEMPYCFEFSYGDEAIMKVKSSYMGRKYGTLIFVEE